MKPSQVYFLSLCAITNAITKLQLCQSGVPDAIHKNKVCRINWKLGEMKYQDNSTNSALREYKYNHNMRNLLTTKISALCEIEKLNRKKSFWDMDT